MPWLQPATNNYSGFHPATAAFGAAQVNLYPVSSSEAGDINIGDVVVLTSIGTMKVAPTGSLASLAAGVAASYLPAAGGILAAKLNSNSSGMVLVYDDPDQVFWGTDTTSAVAAASTAYASTSTENEWIGHTYAICTTGPIGSTGPSSATHQSVMCLSGQLSTHGAGTGVFKILGLHPIENNALSTAALFAAVGASGVRKYLLKFSTHQLDGNNVVPVSTG
jgi:hypothetical protein